MTNSIFIHEHQGGRNGTQNNPIKYKIFLSHKAVNALSLFYACVCNI